MTTTTTHARGSDLGRQYIADGWSGYTNTPECYDHPRYDALMDALIEATHAAGNAALPEGFYWSPDLSEIIGPVDGDLGEEFDPREFAEAASGAVDYDAIEAEVFAGQMTVQIEVSADGGQTWQAIDGHEPASETGHTGTPAEIAEAVAVDYRDTQAAEGSTPGSRYRATVAWSTDGGEETLAVSGSYEIA